MSHCYCLGTGVGCGGIQVAPYGTEHGVDPGYTQVSRPSASSQGQKRHTETLGEEQKMEQWGGTGGGPPALWMAAAMGPGGQVSCSWLAGGLMRERQDRKVHPPVPRLQHTQECPAVLGRLREQAELGPGGNYAPSGLRVPVERHLTCTQMPRQPRHVQTTPSAG